MTVFGLAGMARATIVELPLAAEGEYSSGSLWTTDFDFGVTFTDISHVYIDWSGEIMAGLAVQGLIGPPDPLPKDVGIKAYLSPPIGASTTVWGGEATYPDPEPFDLWSEFELSGSETWSGLLDGQGTIQIYYAELIIADGYYVEHGSVALNSATLVVDGVPVPEPATLLLVGAGFLSLLRNK